MSWSPRTFLRMLLLVVTPLMSMIGEGISSGRGVDLVVIAHQLHPYRFCLFFSTLDRNIEDNVWFKCGGEALPLSFIALLSSSYVVKSLYMIFCCYRIFPKFEKFQPPTIIGILIHGMHTLKVYR